ncbi:PP2C family protein-serine/threonine phosphatase [Kitasatospora sp. NPDC088134]|uniref:PP2C family protein-serine/threonine phosphatase n=1 Tax=Kitasatospora sp. NPDC088134 TaxID=3364071 RepID=UPI003815FDB7
MVAVSVLSHTGVVRRRNEDSAAAGPWTLCATSADSPQTFYFPLGDTPVPVVVADGLGGHPGGDLASALVVSQLAHIGTELKDETAIEEALLDCDAAVREAGAADPALTGMGTTVAGLVLTADAVLVFNVGDSRGYELTATGPRQLTVDDSPPLEPGQRTTHLITSILGGTVEHHALDAHLRRLPLRPGARYLLCTDGLSDPVPPEEWPDLLAEAEDDDQHAVVELWRAAIRAGGPDNITLALVHVLED